MRTLRILHTESSTGLGGQELRILAEARGMIRRGHTVLLALDPCSRLRELAAQHSVPVVPIRLSKSRFPLLVFDFLKLIRRYSIQIVNAHGSLDSWTASLAARLSPQKPIIIRTRHKSIPISRTLRHRALYGWLPHGIITTGRVISQELIVRQKIHPSRIASIPTGVDLSQYKPLPINQALRADFGFLPHHFLIGTVAFLRKYKGLTYLIGAAATVIRKHPETRFLVIGDGPEEVALRNKIAELGLSQYIALGGHREDIPPVLAAMDAFVLPSVEAEGLPQALLQAMAMERPVVATPVGSISEVIEDQTTGLLACPGDSEELSKCILRIIEDRALREKIAQKGKDQVMKTYNLEGMFDQTECFYAQLSGHSLPELCS